MPGVNGQTSMAGWEEGGFKFKMFGEGLFGGLTPALGPQLEWGWSLKASAWSVLGGTHFTPSCFARRHGQPAILTDGTSEPLASPQLPPLPVAFLDAAVT